MRSVIKTLLLLTLPLWLTKALAGACGAGRQCMYRSHAKSIVNFESCLWLSLVVKWSGILEGLFGALITSAPVDLVTMQGALDRKLYLVPSLDIIVTGLGAAGQADGETFNDAFWQALMRTAPRH